MFKQFEIDDMFLFVRLSKGYSRELDDSNVWALLVKSWPPTTSYYSISERALKQQKCTTP